MSGAAPTQLERKTRSDVTRNRERLLDVAKELFSRDGAAASLEGIAREAGLGIGTLYRHFPTREALYEAVYRRDIDHLVALAEDAATTLDPIEALRRWLHATVDMVATKKGMIAAFALNSATTSAVSARFTGRLVASIDPILDRAVQTGQLRPELSGEELLFSVVGMCMLRDQPGWQVSVLKLIDTLIEGLRVRPGHQS